MAFDYVFQGGTYTKSPGTSPALALDQKNRVLLVPDGLGGWTSDNRPASSAVTAYNGGGQTSATSLVAGVNNITTTVATVAPFDSVKLPTSQAGRWVVVANSTSNPIQVFGSGTDTINGQAAATGITQPPNSIDIYVCGVAGAWVVDAGVGYSGQLFCELAQDSITAHAGGGQASATQLWAQTSRITTVATSGDSVKLPPSAPGLEVMVINHGANPMQVYGSGTDTIDDIATATGVTQMQSSLVIYTCAASGAWYSEGLSNGFAGGLQTVSVLDSISAAGSTQGTATVLPARMAYNVSTVAAGTGVLLPASVAGAELAVNNNQATNALLIYPNGTDKINGLAASAGYSAAASTITILYCFTAGQWFTK